MAFLLIALLMFFFSSTRPESFSGVRAGTADLLAPVLTAVNKPVQIAAEYVSAVSGLAGLQDENARLRQENARLREWYQTAQVLKVENETLQKLLHITLPPQHSFITARIIADPGHTYVRTLLVLAGRGAGVEKGQAVLAGDGLAGRIIESGQKASRVLLLSDINSRVPVVIEGSEYHAILAGTNEKLLALDHLPPESDIAEGARVITSGYGGLFPYGLPVGRAVKTETGQWAVEAFADADRLTFVRIVRHETEAGLMNDGL